MSGRERASSSVSSSVELHAEKALLAGGRTGGISMIFGASAGRLADMLGDSGGEETGNEKSGHERGDREEVES